MTGTGLSFPIPTKPGPFCCYHAVWVIDQDQEAGSHYMGRRYRRRRRGRGAFRLGRAAMYVVVIIALVLIILRLAGAY
jgi:hypothetical protein